MSTAQPSFRPGVGMRNAHVQSILTSSPVRRAVVGRRSAQLRRAAKAEIIETPEGVKLLGYATASKHQRAKGLVILLHGWEGSVDSNYLLSSASNLHHHGFEIFRLNFRDHGDTHHLNEDLFHSCRLQEIADAVHIVASRWRETQNTPVFLAGFSLGGNFALRVALNAPHLGTELQRVVAVCPPIHPGSVLTALEQGPSIYERYFCDKWRRSLRRKQSLFPQLYSLEEWFKIDKLRAQTQYLVEHYTDFPGIVDYLEGYSVAGEALNDLQTPTTIVTAADDPVVPVSDFHALPQPAALEVRIEAAGGHCGFLSDWSLRSWIDDYLLHRFLSEADE